MASGEKRLLLVRNYQRPLQLWWPPVSQPTAPSQPLGGLKGSLSAVTHFEDILGSSQLSNVELTQASFFKCNSGSFSQMDVDV